MKNTAKILGLIGVMTLLFSASAISQEKSAVVRGEVEYIKANQPLIVKKNAPVQKKKATVIKQQVRSKYIVDRLKTKKAIHPRKKESFKEPLRYKK